MKDEIFGEDLLLAQFVWKSRVSEVTKTGISNDEETVLTYLKGDFAPTKYLDQDHLDRFRIDFAQLPYEISELTRSAMPTTTLVSEDRLSKAGELLRAYGARRVLVFDSVVHSPERARDLDLAGEVIPLGRILEASAELMDALDVPFDLVSREENPDFFDIIRKEAKVLYDQDAA